MVRRVLQNAWLRGFLRILATYIIAADILPNALLIFINSVGYLPYSDRPGPGWQSPHFPTVSELNFFLGFVILVLPVAGVYGLGFAIAGLVLGLCSLPRWGLRALAAPTAFIANGLMMAGVGWMIAISSLGVYVAAACGALWGLFVFPRLIPKGNLALPVGCRIVLAVVASVGGTYCLIKPLLPDPRLTNAKIEVLRRSDAGSDLSELDLSFVGSAIAKEVRGEGKYISVSRMEFTTDGRNQLRVVLIIDDADLIPNTFLLPQTGDAVYRQSHHIWKEELTPARKSTLSLELSSEYSDGIRLRVKGPCCSSMAESFAPYR